MKPRSHRPLFVLILVCVFGAHARDLRAQHPSPPDTFFVNVQGNLYISRISRGGDTLPASAVIAPAFAIEMLYDSTSRVNYLFSECLHNGVKVTLPNWKHLRLAAAPIAVISDSSHTAPFRVTAGDTVSFYRQLSWYDPKTKAQKRNNFMSLDTLDYVVELVDASSGRRVAMLDSLGVLPCSTRCVPTFYGNRPINALVKYAIPAALNGDTVFVRLKLMARGAGEYYPLRHDISTSGISLNVTSPLGIAYLRQYGGAFLKSTSEKLESLASSAEALDIVMRGDRDIEIRGGARERTSAGIVIYDLLGNVVFAPSMGAPWSPSVLYHFESAGIYYVALVAGGSIVRTSKIVIR